VQDAVAHSLRLRFCKVAVQGQQFSQDSRMQAIMDASSYALFSP
jgi:hypothetical protein